MNRSTHNARSRFATSPGRTSPTALLALALLIPAVPAHALLVTASANITAQDSNPLSEIASATYQSSPNRSDGRVISGFAFADATSGILRAQMVSGSTLLTGTSVPTDGFSAGARISENITIGSDPSGPLGNITSGTLRLVLSGSGLMSATSSGTGDHSFAGFGFSLQAGINGSSNASGEYVASTKHPGAPNVFETDLGNGAIIDAQVIGSPQSGRIVLTIPVQVGDEITFSAFGGANAWSGRFPGNSAEGDFSGTGILGIQLTDGLRWVSDSGLLLTTPVPEPAHVHMLLAGLAVIGSILWQRKARRPGA